MKKRIMAVIVAAVCVFALAACGSGGQAETQEPAEAEAADAGEEAGDSDVAYIKEKGKLIVGITDFAPMDYKDDNGEWTGFDAVLSRKVAEDLGVDVEFVEIDWDNKILELDGKSIDCVWNGMTLTDEVKNSMECTAPYCNNAQIVILPADVAGNYPDVESLKDLSFAVESGSAGEQAAIDNGFNYTGVTAQSDTLLEVSAGTSDAAIIDSLMAGAMVGEGTDYANLAYTIELTTEEYGIGCRKGSDLAAFIDEEMAKFYEDGTINEVAEEFGLQAALVK